MGKLNSLIIQKARKPGRIGDGNCLYLQITETGTKSWIFRYSLNKKSRSMGLGSVDLVTLAEARSQVHEYRKILLTGKDPLEERRSQQIGLAIEKAKSITFRECAEKYIESQKSSWKNEKHALQWPSTLETYAYPIIGHLPINAVDTKLVMQILEPIWPKINETASRLRSRLEIVLAWATVRGYRSGENPASWRNHLDKLLQKRSRVQKVKHHPALPYEQMNEFFMQLREQKGVAPRALEFLILTATRTSEALNAEWSEFNLEEKIWVIPGQRMKAGVEHRIPLSSQAIEILNQARIFSDSVYVFKGMRPGKPLSNVSLLNVLQRMEKDFVTHGFRSTFRDWAAERTNFPREVCEQALAHTIKDKVESAYRRGDLIEKRRILMNDWGKFCIEGTQIGIVLELPLQSIG